MVENSYWVGQKVRSAFYVTKIPNELFGQPNICHSKLPLVS